MYNKHQVEKINNFFKTKNKNKFALFRTTSTTSDNESITELTQVCNNLLSKNYKIINVFNREYYNNGAWQHLYEIYTTYTEE